MANECESCGAPIVWMKTAKNGKPIPVDPGDNVEAGGTFHRDHHTTHFETCPNAKAHRARNQETRKIARELDKKFHEIHHVVSAKIQVPNLARGIPFEFHRPSDLWERWSVRFAVNGTTGELLECTFAPEKEGS